MYQFNFVIFTMPLTLNQVMGKHWRSRHGNFNTVKSEVALKIRLNKPEKPIKKAEVIIHRHSPGTLDRDNAYFTAKPILDALVKEGVLIDDGFEMVKRIHIEQVKIKRAEKKHLRVEVKEIQD